jgi:tight adherence protein C
MKILIIFIALMISSVVLMIALKSDKEALRLILGRIGLSNRSPLLKEDRKNLESYYVLYLHEERRFNLFGFAVRSIEDFLLIKIFLLITSVLLINIIAVIIHKNFLFISLLAGIILFVLPSEILKNKIRSKSRQVLEELPDFIDILYSLINAGLTLEESISYIAKECKGQISSLFKIAKIKMFEGMSRADAYYYVGKISFCDDFQRIIKILTQADVIGNPVKDILKELSNDLRDNQRDLLKIKAERLEGNLIIVIFIFIFIPVLLLFLLPIIPQIKLLFH